MESKELRVGELAGRTGVTVRTLHHWEAMGLLVPDRRTSSGHRLYGAGAVRGPRPFRRTVRVCLQGPFVTVMIPRSTRS
jgi:hypothetical protein